MSGGEEVIPSVLIDNGSTTCMVGFAGEEKPEAVFPSVVGQQPSEDQGILVGDEALSKRATLTLTCPVEGGIITDWDGIEKIWHHAYQKLGVASKDRPVFLTESPFNPKANREKTTQILFEKFNVPALYIGNTGLLCLFASGRTSGVVVDIGYGVTHIVPVHDKKIVPNTIVKLPVSGRDLDNYLVKKLTAEHPYFSKMPADSKVISDVKENLCSVALDFQQELAKANTSSEKSHELPDGQTITIGDERFRCPEALFQPSLLGIESPGIHEILNTSIAKCPASVHKELYANIVLSGGTSLLPGLEGRLQKEMTALAPSGTQVKVIARPEFKYASWIGSSIVASLIAPTNPQMWLSKAEYDESGPSIIHSKCWDNQ
ncbi:actin, cytoplasmic 3-like isoform X1 [Ptychodera flava]|uniref:actin, cytoplasmic 3-like isoform X1 n=1 Tax=Ptychodera flava TaxID=63121 RepID=UPI003969FC1F